MSFCECVRELPAHRTILPSASALNLRQVMRLLGVCTREEPLLIITELLANGALRAGLIFVDRTIACECPLYHLLPHIFTNTLMQLLLLLSSLLLPILPKLTRRLA
jgi:hypothetical protein